MVQRRTCRLLGIARRRTLRFRQRIGGDRQRPFRMGDQLPRQQYLFRAARRRSPISSSTSSPSNGSNSGTSTDGWYRRSSTAAGHFISPTAMAPATARSTIKSSWPPTCSHQPGERTGYLGGEQHHLRLRQRPRRLPHPADVLQGRGPQPAVGHRQHELADLLRPFKPAHPPYPPLRHPLPGRAGRKTYLQSR